MPSRPKKTKDRIDYVYLTNKKIALLKADVLSGAPPRLAAEHLGMSLEQYKFLMKESTAKDKNLLITERRFRANIKAWGATAELEMIHSLLNKPTPKILQWILSRNNPKRWGEPKKATPAVEERVDHALQTQVTALANEIKANLTPEAATSLLEAIGVGEEKIQ